MAEACVSCGEDDDLLFTCQYCSHEFCSSHQFPHHACSRFSKTEEGATGASGASSTATVEGSEAEAGAAAASTATIEGSTDADTTEETEEAEPATPSRAAPAPKSARRFETQETRQTAGAPGTASPATTGGAGGTVRTMDSTRAVGVINSTGDPGTLEEWLSRQTLFTLALKVGLIALLVNVAFYGGLALTLYDPLRLGL